MQKLLQELVLASIVMSSVFAAGDSPESKSVAAVQKIVLKELDAKALASEPFQIKSMNDIPAVCEAVAKILCAQQIFKGSGDVPKVSKVLPISSHVFSRICALINNFARIKISKQHWWSIGAFGPSDSYQLCDERDKYIPSGLSLGIYEGYSLCTPSELRDAYDASMVQLADGWGRANASDYPDIWEKKDPELWYFFIKRNKEIGEETTFLNVCAAYMNMHSCIRCEDLWKGLEYRSTLYMWVKKDAYEQVAKALHPIKIPLDLVSEK